MLLSLLRGGDITTAIIGVCVSFFVVLCILPLHEFAHAFVADKLGDDTPRRMGRLTLYPFSHIDWIGALMILLVGFGYAKPVPVNAGRTKLKNKKAAMAIIAAAGPISNLLVALVCVFFVVFICARYGIASYISEFGVLTCCNFILQTKSAFAGALGIFLYYCAYINVNLAVFNLIPIPPLDGSRLLTAFLPNKTYFKIMQYERYITIAIFVLLLTGALTTPLSYLSNLILSGFEHLAGLIF